MRVSLLLLILFFTHSLVQSQQTGLLGDELIVYTDARQDRVILFDTRSESKRELRLGEGLHNVWGFSPDGCRILYSLTAANGLSRIYTSRLDGTDMIDLVQYAELSPAQWGAWEPQWSANDLIAFKLIRDGLENESERQYHIAYVDPSGGEPRFYSVTGREHTPQWSPDGEWLAYISYDERVPGIDIYSTAEPETENDDTSNRIREADLWVVSADGETKYPLTSFPVGSVDMPRWSPDGDLISFVYSPSPANNTFWIVGNAQGAIPTQLSFTWNLTLASTWLPDSTAILASARDIKGYAENHLWKIPIIGNADEIAELFIDGFSHTDFPVFNSTGDKLAFRSDYVIVIYDLATRTPKTIPLDLGNTPFFWSPANFTGEGQCNL